MTSKQYDECLIIEKFLSSYHIHKRSQDSMIISSISQPQPNTYLIRTLNLHSNSSSESSQLQQITQTLSQHQLFSCKNLYSLLNFEILHNRPQNTTKFRAIYQYGTKTLQDQIQKRRLSQNCHFQQEALWGLLYSIITPLEYLQKKNVIYGVLDPSGIFLDKHIALIDPSSTAIDPFDISSPRLFSPQLLHPNRIIQQIDMFKSDIYVCGILMLQAILLNPHISISCNKQQYMYENHSKFIQHKIEQINLLQIYSVQLVQMIQHMLAYNCEDRPCFREVLKNIGEMFQISMTEVEQLQPLREDGQNVPNSQIHEEFCFLQEVQVVDVLVDDNLNFYHVQCEKERNQHYKHNYNNNNYQNNSQTSQCYYYENQQILQNSQIVMSQYQKANLRFFNHPPLYYGNFTYNRSNNNNEISSSTYQHIQQNQQSIQLSDYESPFQNQNIEQINVTKRSEKNTKNTIKQSKSKQIKNRLVHINDDYDDKKSNINNKDENINYRNVRRHQRSSTFDDVKKYQKVQTQKWLQKLKTDQIVHKNQINLYQKQCFSKPHPITFKYSSIKQNQPQNMSHYLKHYDLKLASNKQNLFTDPKIMSMIKSDIRRIQQKKAISHRNN